MSGIRRRDADRPHPGLPEASGVMASALGPKSPLYTDGGGRRSPQPKVVPLGSVVAPSERRRQPLNPMLSAAGRVAAQKQLIGGCVQPSVENIVTKPR